MKCGSILCMSNKYICIEWIVDRYETSEWGWSDKEKREEMTEDKAWYLLARDADNNNAPVAVVHFRFDLDNDDEVLYWFVAAPTLLDLCKKF